MKLVCSKSNLLNGVQIVSRAVPNKTTMSILECILIDASNGIITLTANDMDMGIETVIEGDIVESGVIALDAKIFLEIVRKLPDSFITIDTDASYKTLITCEKAKFTIVGKSGEDFSYLPMVEKEESIVISQFSLKEMVRQTIFSISDNDNNKLMTGELFEINGDELKIVSSDGHRISIRKIALREIYEHRKVIVPGKTLNEVSKILPGGADSDLTVYFTDKHIVFEFDNTVVVSRLIEGEYFSIDRMLSGDYETKVRVNKKELLNCIDRATLLTREGDRKPIVINISDEGMELKIDSALGSMKEEIDIEKQGRDLMIGFNPKFLIDALRVIDDEEVDLYMVNPKAPCFIKNEEESYIYLILPVSLVANYGR
ncbi:DNA polymerase III subunit beta [uncultured Acetatifactor sp.]|jgi:DNA polymerase-3 subunit beta|uniref:DNA polymerase III subunit beta n=1 Tax=uncultured Acetatifactor sp. TaxID=1671927 RepID=UPI00262508F9|nr:DNA polymerase III subunit beta [uncultured Acetatifactor sp.]MCI8697416.1 DNA polymerase III subunit beta [Lachnospiraceae bacterium]